MTEAAFENELRLVEQEILKRYDRRASTDRRVSAVHVPVDFRLYGRRRGDEDAPSFPDRPPQLGGEHQAGT